MILHKNVSTYNYCMSLRQLKENNKHTKFKYENQIIIKAYKLKKIPFR